MDTAGPSRPLAIREDVFHQLDINPLDEVLNSALITYYTTDMGRIKSRRDTRLTWKNQRRIGKAVRRARAMGLIPSFSRWDERMVRDS
jgi:small subunit ribosomal protein S18